MKIYPIVEGHGEVQAAPVLLRRLLAEARCHGIEIGKPIRRTASQMRNKQDVQNSVKLALLQPECVAIVFLFDGEDDCPAKLAKQVRTWVARETDKRVPYEVVIAYREYETWFLASLESLRGKYGIAKNATAPENPEAKRDAKGALEEYMPTNRAYSETGDQPGMSGVFDMKLAFQRNRSFRKLIKAFGDILAGLNHNLSDWPPASWSQPDL